MSTDFKELLQSAPRWQWYWNDMCGPTGFEFWSLLHHDIGLCFQQLCLQIPFLFLFAIISAFYFGSPLGPVLRSYKELYYINLRCFICFLLTMLPIVQTILDVNYADITVQPVNMFLSATQVIAWFIHFAFLTALRRKLGPCPRGPIFVLVIWSIIAILTVISFRSHLIIYNNSDPSPSITLSLVCASISLSLQIFYALTLLPGPSFDTQRNYLSRYEQIGERTPLLDGNGIFTRYERLFAGRGISDDNEADYLGVAMEDTPFLSRLLFYWVHTLMQKGVEGRLTNADALYDLPIDLTCSTLSQKLDKALIGNVDEFSQAELINLTTGQYGSVASTSEVATVPNVYFRRHNISLLRALHHCFSWQFYGIGILKLIADCSGFAGPLLLNKLVSFIENKSENISTGYLYALGLCLTTLLAAFCNAHFSFQMGIVGLKIRGAIVTAVYRKTLTASSTILNSKFSVGEIVNFMSTDTDRIVNSCPSFHAVWSIPFQLAVTLYLLYKLLGIAFLAGVIFSIILIPINKLIANKIGTLSTKMMKKKDERVQLMTETLRGIRTIKFHVWEKHFLQSILNIRDGELKYLKGRKYLDALCVYFWATTPVLISILTFTTYVLLENKLTAATVFTSIALLNMLIGPLNAFPWVLNGVTEAWVSIKRIQALLDVYDLDYDKYYNDTLLTNNSSIVIKNGQFSWGYIKKSNDDKQIDNKKIDPIVSPHKRQKSRRNLHPKRTESGHIQQKELLYSDVESLTSKQSDELISDDFYSDVDSFVSDQRGSDTNFEFYLTSINLNIKKGQFVGIMGSVGSGKSSLLSSIIAEVEKNTGDIGVRDRHLGFGYVPQQPWLQRGTLRDNILFGKVYDERRYKMIIRACCLEDDIHLLSSGDLTGIGDSGNTLSGGQKARIALARAIYQDKPIYIMDDFLSAVDGHVATHLFQHCLLGLLKNKTRIFCTHHLQYLLHVDHLIVLENGHISKQGNPSDILTDIEEILLPDTNLSEHDNISINDQIDMTSVDLMKQPTVDNIMLNQEYSETGSVDSKVYAVYWKSVGHLISFLIIIAIILMQGSRNFTDIWLSVWISASSNSTATNSSNLTNYMLNDDPSPTSAPVNPNIMYYLTVYALLAGINSFFTLFRAFLFAYGGIQAAKRIHQELLRKVIYGKLRFFDVSPLGRILNRFSSDTYTVDDSLPFILNILLAQLFGLMGSVMVTIYGLPWLCLVLTPLIPVYHWLQQHYRLTSRELKRLSSLTLSPVYSHFNETLQGLPTIRAFRSTQRFRRDNEEYLEANQKSQFASNIANQWLNLRLQFIGVAMVSGVGVIAVIQHQFDVVDPGLVGLAISYALSVTGLLSGVINAFTETEREMIAVERVNQYIEEVQPEDLKDTVRYSSPYGWPKLGSIQFVDVVLRYRELYTLQMVSFEIKNGEKVGVVGRTGAGKSTLFAALFRMADYMGDIWIDDVVTSTISLEALRTRLSIIPQEPFLFTGTVRENLDPLNEFRSQEMWNALQRCNLTGAIKQLGGLQASLGSGGQKLSVGQRQLLCLARAVLRKAKILCIDEATANVDMETDRQIQQTIRTTFVRSTIITIAHRVQTIMDSDRVMVMDDGKILEYASPKQLLNNPSSHFYQLAKQQNLL